MNIDKIILGSQSPRRREYIQLLNLPVTCISPDVDETFPAEMSLTDVPEHLAKLKADSLNIELKFGELLITSDTVVLLEGELIGKPTSNENAVELLTKLSGKTHEVITGVCLKTFNLTLTFKVSTLVTFGPLSNDEIMYYVSHYKPLDKAGAYGIQEYIGFIGVEKIEGSYMNVIGLPLAQIRQKIGEL